MKNKSYISPETICIKISTMRMIALSGDKENLINAESYTDGGTLSGSRRGSSWDDEDDE